jgi:transposase-like protein
VNGGLRRLKGLSDSITTTWEYAVVQTCILHLIRNTFRADRTIHPPSALCTTVSTTVTARRSHLAAAFQCAAATRRRTRNGRGVPIAG